MKNGAIKSTLRFTFVLNLYVVNCLLILTALPLKEQGKFLSTLPSMYPGQEKKNIKT